MHLYAHTPQLSYLRNPFSFAGAVEGITGDELESLKKSQFMLTAYNRKEYAVIFKDFFNHKVAG
jgi:hypothetical protein